MVRSAGPYYPSGPRYRLPARHRTRGRSTPDDPSCPIDRVRL